IEDLSWRAADAAWTASFVAQRRTPFAHWPLLTGLFPWQLSGAPIKRTWPIGPTPRGLYQRWRSPLAPPPVERAPAVRRTRDRDLGSSPGDLRRPERRLTPLSLLNGDAECIEPVEYAYRSFDRQWVLPDARLGDFMRPALWRVLGPRQVFLTSLLTNVLGP